MDSRQNKGFIIPGQEKKEKEWKWSRSKEGDRLVRVPSSMRIRPNKYNPRKGKKIKAPKCYGTMDSSLHNCKACMWRFTCGVKTFIPRYQDSTGEG